VRVGLFLPVAVCWLNEVTAAAFIRTLLRRQQVVIVRAEELVISGNGACDRRLDPAARQAVGLRGRGTAHDAAGGWWHTLQGGARTPVQRCARCTPSHSLVRLAAWPHLRRTPRIHAYTARPPARSHASSSSRCRPF